MIPDMKPPPTLPRAARARPAVLRSLGPHDPPAEITIAGGRYHRVEIFKHDSWAATALYGGPARRIVCKFNRVQPVGGLPTAWLGRWLARREAGALTRLAGVPGIPAACGPVLVGGRPVPTAVAHEYIPGHPLADRERPGPGFFPALVTLLRAVHRHAFAYVDLHKRENIIVGEDGRPYLVDFQACFALSPRRAAGDPWLRPVLRALQETDLYHLAKHIGSHSPAEAGLLPAAGDAHRPWWIRAHRVIARPLRERRRAFLAAIGVRAAGGRVESEVFPEDAVRHDSPGANARRRKRPKKRPG